MLHFFLLLCALCVSHATQTKSFIIKPTSSETQSISTTINSQTVFCNFTYGTNPEPVKEKAQQKDVEIKITDVVARLRGTCSATTINYWTYELCFGGTIRQYHGSDIYILGNTGGEWQGKHELYKKGMTCDGITDRVVERQSLVKYGCKKDALSPVIVNINEPSMCQYEISVGIASVCGDPTFPILADSVQGQTIVFDESEEWFLELTETVDSQGREIALCSSYSLATHVTGSRLKFVKWIWREEAENCIFSLLIGRGDVTTTSKDLSAPPSDLFLYTARHPGRVPIGTDEIEVFIHSQPQETGSAVIVQTLLQSASSFIGKLSYLKLYSYPSLP